ncbi:MAG: VCBS repeat-containing protein [Oscillospiraceae bacterium]|nr:VCBS repeat-containing protein [Oscillospiraceae bacterium]
MRRMGVWAACVCLLLTLTGCFSLVDDELLVLPRQPQDSVKLQRYIDEHVASGGRQIAPLTGLNRQTIQKVDIDGDKQEEAVLFFRFSGDTPLKIFFYRIVGEEYEPFARVDGEGDSIQSVTYADLNNDGTQEVIVGWRVVGGAFKAMTVYTLRAEGLETVLSTSYSGYALHDMDENGRTDLLVLRYQDTEKTGMVEMYQMGVSEISEITPQFSAPLSRNIEGVIRARTGLLDDGYPALYVVSQYGSDAMVTDVVALQKRRLTNISRDPTTGVSDGTVRSYLVPSLASLSDDGVIDIPRPVALSAYDPEAENAEPVWIIQWIRYRSDGEVFTSVTTYHNYTDNWYIELPASWTWERLAMTRRDISANERGVVFALRSEEGAPPSDMLTIYTLTGDNMEELAAKPGRAALLTGNNMIVAAEIDADAPVSNTAVARWMHWLQKDWMTGELTTL